MITSTILYWEIDINQCPSITFETTTISLRAKTGLFLPQCSNKNIFGFPNNKMLILATD